MPVGAAILGSAGIGAWGANNAANTQAGFGQQALAYLNGTLGPVMAQGKSIVNSALGPLAKLLTPGADQTATLSQLPGFEFAQDWGQKAVANLGSTTGLGGNMLAAGAKYATGVAQQGFGALVGGLQNFLNSGVQPETDVGNALAGGVASTLGTIGNARAAGTLGGANALAGGVSGLGTYSLLSKLLPQNQNNNTTPGTPPNTVYTNDTTGTEWG